MGGRERRGRRVPWGVVGMLGLVMAIESNLRGRDLDFTEPWHWDWRYTGRLAMRPDKLEGRRILCFGDSLIKFGLSPKVIERTTGLPAYNFALHTGQTSTSYFMLRRSLEAGGKPSAAVFELTPHMLMSPPEVNKMLWAELLSPAECLDMAGIMRSPRFFASTMLAELLMSYKERHEIRARVTAALAGISSWNSAKVPVYRRNWKVNDGAQLMIDEGFPKVDPTDWALKLYSKWEPDPVNVEYLGRFLALAESREVSVYWLLPPMHPEVQHATDVTGFDHAFTAFVQQVQAEHPGTIVVDGRHAGFSADLFVDGVHLNRRGASKLSSAVAEVLNDPTRGPATRGWLSLDLARVREVEMEGEDLGQSFRALRDPNTVRR